MKALRMLGLAIVLVLVVLAGLVLAIRAGVFNPSYEKAVAEFATPPSKFIDVNGVKVHIRDEGHGPVLLMLHSSMTNLRIWDQWADALKSDYRVVRIDWPPYGLTVDNSGKAGSEHASTIVEGVVNQLGLNDIVLIGSSSGATLSVVYASKHPDKVRALALSSLPLKSPPNITKPFAISFWNWAHKTLFPNWYPSVYWRSFVGDIYGDPKKLTEHDVRMFTDTNNIKGGFARVNVYLKANQKSVWTTGAGGYAEKITAPVLLQWGDKDPVLPPYLADFAVQSLKNSHVEVIHYPLGHYPMIEDPTTTVRDLKVFLASLPPPKSQPAAPAAAG